MTSRNKQKKGPLSLFEGQYFFGLSAVRLRRRLKEEAHAEVISERSYDWSVEERRRRFKELGWLTLIAIACVIILSYFLFVPAAVVRLSRNIAVPSAVYDVYKRTIKFSLNYVPAEAQVKSAPVKQLARGAMYETTMSTDMFVDVGLQGIFRMSVANQGGTESAPTVSVAYRVISDETKNAKRAYVLFSEWPPMFQSVIPILSGTSQWYQYEENTTSPTSPALDVLLMLPAAATQTFQHDFFQLLLDHALAVKALQLSFTSLPYKHSNGKRVVNIDWSLNSRRVPAVLQSLTRDPRYGVYKQSMQTSIVGLPSLEEMTASLSSLAGSATIGVWDRVTYEASLYFGLSDPSFGHVRGRMTTALHATDAAYNNTPPEQVVSFTSLLERINTFLRLKSLVTSSPAPSR